MKLSGQYFSRLALLKYHVNSRNRVVIQKRSFQQFITSASIIKHKRQDTSWGERDVSVFRNYPVSVYRELGNHKIYF